MINVPSASTPGNARAKIVSMAAKNDRNPLTHFGRQVRKDRQARGWSLDEMAARTGLAAPYWSQIENGKRPPTERVALACDAAFPERRGWYLEYYEESKSWTPAGFRSWGEYEDRARDLRVWSPGVVDGLLQTEDYAREMLRIHPGVTDEIVSTRLANRMERQKRILHREDPPNVWFVVDEVALYRYVVSPEVMAEQMRHLGDVASLPNVTMQVLPAVAHPANASELIIADSAAFVEHMVSGFVYTDDQTVSSLARMMATILSESNKASDSLAMIERMEATWTRGVSRPTAATAELPASKSPRRRRA
jgi:transcriptional regulator with XRE-family HTH domain